jgi:hypothetical protein
VVAPVLDESAVALTWQACLCIDLLDHFVLLFSGYFDACRRIYARASINWCRAIHSVKLQTPF